MEIFAEWMLYIIIKNEKADSREKLGIRFDGSAHFFNEKGIFLRIFPKFRGL